MKLDRLEVQIEKCAGPGPRYAALCAHEVRLQGELERLLSAIAEAQRAADLAPDVDEGD